MNEETMLINPIDHVQITCLVASHIEKSPKNVAINST